MGRETRDITLLWASMFTRVATLPRSCRGGHRRAVTVRAAAGCFPYLTRACSQLELLSREG